MNVIDKRNKIFSGLLMGLFICFAVFLAAISLTVDKPAGITRADVYEGGIYADRVLLTDFENLDSSNNPEKQHARSLTYPEAYSHLLGYNSTRYGGTSGLRDRYSDWLYDGKRNKNGKDLQLAINHNLQLFCYDALNAFGKNGSIVVIDNETGAIKALVSTKESGIFDANEVDSLEFSELPDGFLIGEHEQKYVPGSTFKVLSAIALIENGNDSYKYNDKTGYINVGGGTVHNAGNSIKGELGLKESLKESANVYYVSALEIEGFYNQLKDVTSRFKLGEEIKLDFCTLNSSFDYTPENEFQKALAVFGQGNESAVTPIQNAMIFGCIMNNGTMMKPYVVKTNTERGFFEELFNMNCEVKPEVLAKNVISKKTAKRIKEALEYTAVEGYGLPEGCIIAKSGTGELPNGKNQLWLCAATEDYSICISMTSQGYSSSLIKPMKNILGFIENNEIN